MAKTLAIKVKYSSDGEEKVIKNVNELETAIESLNGELKQLDFGSEEYKRTASELKGLRSALKDVEKETEGLDVEQRLSAIGGALEVVTGTFLIASSAARTFGASAETVEEVEKLEQQALEAVNIALGVRTITEGLVQAAQLKRVIVEKAANVQTRISTALQTAYTAVVGTSTGALKAFRIALASTGIGLVVVALGALIANWDKLTKSIGGSTQAQDDFNKVNAEAQKQIGKTQVELDFYAGIVNDVSKSELERAEALEELNRLGVITDDITLDNVDSLDMLNERLELARENILLKSQAEAAASLLSESIKAQIEAQNSSLDDNISFFETVTNSILSFGNSWAFASRQVQTGAENQAEAVNQAGQDVSRYETLYLELLEKLNENEAKLRGEREKADKNRKDRNKEKEDRNKIDSNYAEILEENIRLTKAYREEIKLLATGERNEVKVIQQANNLIERQNKLLEERLGILGSAEGELVEFQESLRRLVTPNIIPSEEEQREFADNFAGIFQSAQSLDFTVDVEEKSLERVKGLIGELSKEEAEVIGEESLQILIDYFQKQVDLNELTQEYNADLKKSIEDRYNEEQALLLERVLAGEITTEQQIAQLRILQEQRDTELALIADKANYNQLVRDVFDIQRKQTEELKSQKEVDEEINNLVSQQLFDGKLFNELGEDQVKLVNQVVTGLKEQSTLYDGIVDVTDKLRELNTQINDNIDKQNQKLSDAQFQQLEEFIRQNNTRIDQFEKFFDKLGLGTDVLKSKLKELGEEGFQAYLKEMLNSTNLTVEQFEAIQELINNIKFDNLIDNINEIADKVIQEFNQITSGIQNVMSAAVSLQLEQLDYFEAQLLASIGDETERAREIQEETRKEIAEQRFELEKKARLQELRFSLAGAIANGAQAVLKAIATVPPPGGQILAGIYGGITAAQVAVINDQINFTKGTEFIARRGGLVVGASHEDGGVMANGGSIILEGGEAIINKNAVSQFSDLLSQMNVSTGGRSLERDDSALVQEIRKQNQRPIKTYVLYNDIQNTNKINSRLQQISRL